MQSKVNKCIQLADCADGLRGKRLLTFTFASRLALAHKFVCLCCSSVWFGLVSLAMCLLCLVMLGNSHRVACCFVWAFDGTHLQSLSVAQNVYARFIYADGYVWNVGASAATKNHKHQRQLPQPFQLKSATSVLA
jgi:hypothetical protein